MSFQHRFVQGLGVKKRMHPPYLLGRVLLAITLLVLGTQAAQAVVQTCSNGWLPPGDIASPPDLKVTGTCPVKPGTTYYYGNVNILAGGILLFYENYADGSGSITDFWASSIIIENGGELSAYGRDEDNDKNISWQAFGFNGGVLTIHLYGKNEAEWDPNTQKFVQQNQGALCQSPLGAPGPGKTPAPCGIPQATWDSNGAIEKDLPGLVSDYFYQYGPLHGDGKCSTGTDNTDNSVFKNGKCVKPNGDESPNAQVGYFGNKVLAVSYGGILTLNGHKGATFALGPDDDPYYAGSSWIRLADGSSLEVGGGRLVLEQDPSTWKAGDEIVVTTTDYLPGHSEKLQILYNYTGGTTIDFEAVDSPTKKIQWPHNGVRYGGPNDTAHKKLTDRLPDRLKNSLDSDHVVKSGAETRAAVALLSRSIRIVSAGLEVGEDFHREATGYSYGAHMVIRQGFKAVQIKGVEFQQMGQGGRLGHYPIHFHKARQTPANTWVKDSSINESMTRWIVLHSTLGVTVARNVGYKSIGHGFYLEDGTETDNKFWSNIGIFARAAVDNKQNPRTVPGILAANQETKDVTPFPFVTDSTYPSVFWITNGWNDFIGNMAAGAGACGAAYWFVPVLNSDRPDVPTANNVQDGTQ